MTAKYWCFTLNNPIHPAYKDVLLEADCAYIAFQYEKGERGTPHYQGHVEFGRKLTMRTVKDKLRLVEVHLEPRAGTFQESEDYCTKDKYVNSHGIEITKDRIAGPWRKGRPATDGQGSRSDLNHVAILAKNGTSIQQIQEDYPAMYVKFHAGLEKLCNDRIPKRKGKAKSFVFYGIPGAGKSVLAYEICKIYCNGNEDDIYFLAKNNKSEFSWDGYTGQKCVIINDFYGKGYAYSALLTLIDYNPANVRMMYRFRKFTSEYVFITSNIHPNRWYPNVEDKRALIRRFDNIYEFKSEWEYNPHDFTGIEYFPEKKNDDIMTADGLLQVPLPTGEVDEKKYDIPPLQRVSSTASTAPLSPVAIPKMEDFPELPKTPIPYTHPNKRVQIKKRTPPQ